MPPQVSIVVPTYNERENLPILLERINRVMKGFEFEVIVVDDNSPDGTWALAEKLARDRYPWLRVIRRIGERGLASAVVRGFKEARGELIVVIDADLQHPPEVIPLMIKKALSSNADLVVASRYAPGGGVEGWSRLRRVMSLVATLIAKLLLPESKCTSDPLSGFFLVRRSLVSRCMCKLKPKGYKILLEVLVKCNPRRVVDVAYTFRPRARGTSKLGVKTIIEYIVHVLRLQEYRLMKNALVGLSGIGVLLGLLHLTTDVLSLSNEVGYGIALESSIVNNYVLNDLLVFRGRRSTGFFRGLVDYHLAVGVGALVNYSTFTVLTLLGVWKYLAALVGVALGFIANYLMSEHYVWRKTTFGGYSKGA